jgi:hypothetical protein
LISAEKVIGRVKNRRRAFLTFLFGAGKNGSLLPQL